jgi:membrane-bound ClpP family serine protease
MILAILLLGLGLALVMAEVLFPSFGVLSVLATLAIVGAVAMAFRESNQAGVRFLIAVVLLVPAMIMLGLKVFPRSPLGKKMVAAGLSFESERATDPRDLELVGQEGLVEAPCRPAGMARIASRRVDVVTRGDFIESGERVRVAEVQGNRVVVVRVTDENETPG